MTLDEYTQPAVAVTIPRALYLLVKPGTNLRGEFEAWDTITQKLVRMNGEHWCITKTDVEPL